MQFWNEEQTKKSRELLNMLASSVDFVLIGGWAVYMYGTSISVPALG